MFLRLYHFGMKDSGRSFEETRHLPQPQHLKLDPLTLMLCSSYAVETGLDSVAILSKGFTTAVRAGPIWLHTHFSGLLCSICRLLQRSLSF